MLEEEARLSGIHMYKYFDHSNQNVLQVSSLRIPITVKMEMQSKTPCQIVLDGKFGPGIHCSQFDFTITFEQEIFGILVSSIFLILITLRLWRLSGREVIAFPHSILWAKVVGLLPNSPEIL